MMVFKTNASEFIMSLLFPRRATIALALLTGFSCLLHAQVNTATLLGNVTDPSKAAVPNATVALKNLGTAQTRTVNTDSNGSYTIPNLGVGHYSVTVSATGFKTSTIPDVELQVAQSASVNVVLQLGQMTESVTVSGEAPLMNTVSSTVSQVVDTKAVESMPLNGRNFWQLTQLTPGASYVQGGQNIPTNGTSIRASAVNVNINGMSPIWTGWALDGANITESQLGGTIIQPNVDALQEFRVQGADMSAEYGHTPTLVNATLKSGGNALHGDVYWFFRNNAMDARNFFFLPPPGVNQSNEPLHRNQSGGTLGGPIVRNRTFFFVDFEDTQLSQEQDFNNVVASPAERLGDFSQVKKAIIDPLTGQPFAGNIIPASRLSSQAQFFLPYMPQANIISGGAYRSTVTNALTQALNKGDIKIDHQLTEKDHLMGRYSISNNQETDPNPYPAIGNFPLQSRGQNATIDLTHIFNPQWINDARVSYYRSYFNFAGALQGQDINGMAGVRGFEGIPEPGFPQIAISGYSNFTGSPSDSRPKQNRVRSWQYADSVTYVTGKHNMKFGWELTHNTNTFISGSTSMGTFSFLGTYTGDGFADFMLGYPDNVQRSYFRYLWGSNANFNALYYQDSYRVTSRLTLNLGVRWEINPFYNAVGGQTSGFDFTNGNLILPTGFSLTSQPQTATLYPLFQDRIELTNALGLPQSVRPTSYKNWAPRIGLAWRPTDSDRWVIRSGFGIYYAFPDDNNINNTQNVVPFNGTQTVVNNRPPLAPQLTFGNFFQGQPIVAANAGGAVCAFGYVANSCSTPNVVSAPVNVTNTYSQQWNFSIQHELMSGLTIDAAYVGNRSNHVQQTIEINDPLPGPGAIQGRRQYSQWGTIGLGEWGGSEHYNSLQVKVESREWHGASFLMAYTYSRCIDDGTGESGTITAVLVGPGNNGVCNFDLHHNLVFSYVYALPFGKGRAFMNHLPGWAETVAGGWSVSGITTLQSGLPFTPTISTDQANTGVGGQRPELVGQPMVPGNPSCWFYVAANSACGAIASGATNAFAVPSLYTYGNSGRNILRADGLAQFDFTVQKQFRFTESKWVELRGEFFNIFNSPTFSAPTTTINVASGGQVGSTLNAARTIELALKVFF
jgi:hypothetical protein